MTRDFLEPLVRRLSNPEFQQILGKLPVTRNLTRTTQKGELEGGA
jgi:hypothetical protein